MALIFSNFLWPPEPLLQYPCARAQELYERQLAWSSREALVSDQAEDDFWQDLFADVVLLQQLLPQASSKDDPKDPTAPETHSDKAKYSESGVAPANQTKERSVHELFTGAFRNKSSM